MTPLPLDEDRLSNAAEGGPANRRLFSIMAVLGWALMSYGVYGLIINAAQTHPSSWLVWFLGGIVVHDFLLAPVVIGVGVLLSRAVPDRYRGPVQGALVAGGIVALTALPYVLGFGRSSSNPSALPNNYAAALGILLVLIAAVAAVLVALRRNR